MADDTEGLFSRTVAFMRWRFTSKELILAVLLVVGVLCFIVFASLYGKESSDLAASTAKLSDITSKQCGTSACYQTIAYAETYLNRSQQPCDNFYQFACGMYREKKKMSASGTVLTAMRQRTQDKMKATLTGGTWPGYLNKSSAERKLKYFYGSCMDVFRKDQLKGKPFIDKVLPLLGGSYLTDRNWEAQSWDRSTALQNVQTDLWLDALFAPSVGSDPEDSKKRIIYIYPGGTGRYMRWNDYLSTSAKKKKLQADYKNFMNTLATLIARDAQVMDEQLTNRIGVFVHDAYDVEKRIATFASNARYQRSRYKWEKKISLRDLKASTGSEIDWTAQMNHLFNEVGVTDDTLVVEPYPTYLSNLTYMIRNLDPGERNRKLHNYLTWRVMEVYVQDLSWEYVHANRQLFVDKYGYANFLGTEKYCFRLALRYFDHALSALYVSTYFEAKNKDKVTEITGAVRTALENLINKNTWMDQRTKDYAIAKMKGSTYKIGYPDLVGDQSKVDAFYQKLDINRSDFFGNLLASNMQHRRYWNKLVIGGEDRSEWWFNAYDVNLGVWWYWDEVIVPAGILQFPLYMYNMPHYYSFGAIGTVLGHFVHHLIDDRGRIWDKGGDLIQNSTGWWSNQTLQNFKQAKQCVADLYNNVTQGPYITINGQDYTVAVNGDQYAGEAMAITTGIRIAYNAYQAWKQKYGNDPHPPGLKFTPEQLFFIGHAQVYCYNRDPIYDYFYTLYRNTNEETSVNIAFQELPEFAQAFSCQSSDKMMSLKPCPYY